MSAQRSIPLLILLLCCSLLVNEVSSGYLVSMDIRYIAPVLLLWSATIEAFKNTQLSFGGVSDTRTPVEIRLSFDVDWDLHQHEIIRLKMPFFTRRDLSKGVDQELVSDNRYDVPIGGLVGSPSRNFSFGWKEGNIGYNNWLYNDPLYDNADSFTNASNIAFYHSELLIQVNYDYILPNASDYVRKKLELGLVEVPEVDAFLSRFHIDIIVDKSSGINAYCGFPSGTLINESYVAPTPPIVLSMNSTNSVWKRNPAFGNYTFAITNYPGIGLGCSGYKDCSGHGRCDYCRERCICIDGYASPHDLLITGTLGFDGTCEQMVCPTGKAIADVPSSYNKAHEVAECSNRGKCDRSTGTCQCFPPFTGSACERLGCPNDCSGHGKCLSMQELTRISYANQGDYSLIDYGSSNGLDTSAWDFDVMHGCLCDSSWEVGYMDGQTQVSEWFGADCSLRHCPSGDDPFTIHDELVCQGKSQLFPNNPNALKGQTGNLCHVDCSNRGLCDYKTGLCKCFEGSWGDDCGQFAGGGNSIKSHLNYSAAILTGN